MPEHTTSRTIPHICKPWFVWLALACCLLSACGDEPDSDSETTALAGETQHFKFYVLDRESQFPLEGASVRMNIGGEHRDLTSNNVGRCSLYIPRKESKSLAVDVSLSGYVPVKVNWRGPDAQEPIPDQFTVLLDSGTTIGGIVQDEESAALGNAKVRVSAMGEQSSPRAKSLVQDRVAMTDNAGKWSCDLIPSRILKYLDPRRAPGFSGGQLFPRQGGAGNGRPAVHEGSHRHGKRPGRRRQDSRHFRQANHERNRGLGYVPSRSGFSVHPDR